MSDISDSSLKKTIADNLTLLAGLFGKKRREVCADLDISYTTYCDWLNARTYPRMEAMEQLASYYRISVRDLLTDIAGNETMVHRLTSYAEGIGVHTSAEDPDPGELRLANSYYFNPDSCASEMIDGHLYPRALADSVHQNVLLEMAVQLRAHIRQNRIPAQLFVGPYQVELPTPNGTVVLPDISVIYDHSKISDQGCKGAPDVIMEIATASSYDIDSRIKQPLYEDAGVSEYWLIVPHLHQVFIYRKKKTTGSNFFDRAGGYSFRDYITSDVISGFTVRMSALGIGI